MSIGGDEYDERGRTGGSGPSKGRGPTRHATRTRLPGEDGDVHGVGRRPSGRSPGRSLLMVMAVVVLLIAAIAFANRSDDSGGGAGNEASDPKKGGEAQPTAPTGKKPVRGQDAETGIPSGFPHTQQGAQSAAANYAVALGGDGMFKRESRHAVVDAVYTREAAAKLKVPQDKAYSKEFLGRLGLDPNGNPPEGQTFVSRTVPVGTEVQDFSQSSATVSVWYTGLIGITGGDSKNPVRSTWQTWTFHLAWTGSDWKITSDTQKEGPAPVPGDNRASEAEEIAKAVDQYGGFTYAR